MEQALKNLLPPAGFGEVDPRRQRMMRGNKAKDTKPERIVRSLVHRMGYRFRLHHPHLSGRPDIVLSRHKKIIDARGCFWHGHACKVGSRVFRRNSQFWNAKQQRNRERDRKNLHKLQAQGWQVHVVWECQVIHDDPAALTQRLWMFLTS